MHVAVYRSQSRVAHDGSHYGHRTSILDLPRRERMPPIVKHERNASLSTYAIVRGLELCYVVTWISVTRKQPRTIELGPAFQNIHRCAGQIQRSTGSPGFSSGNQKRPLASVEML